MAFGLPTRLAWPYHRASTRRVLPCSLWSVYLPIYLSRAICQSRCLCRVNASLCFAQVRGFCTCPCAFFRRCLAVVSLSFLFCTSLLSSSSYRGGRQTRMRPWTDTPLKTKNCGLFVVRTRPEEAPAREPDKRIFSPERSEFSFFYESASEVFPHLSSSLCPFFCRFPWLNPTVLRILRENEETGRRAKYHPRSSRHKRSRRASSDDPEDASSSSYSSSLSSSSASSASDDDREEEEEEESEEEECSVHTPASPRPAGESGDQQQGAGQAGLSKKARRARGGRRKKPRKHE